MTIKTAVKAAQPYIKENNYDKVWKIFEGEVTEESFINNLIDANSSNHSNAQMTEANLKFIASFQNSQWDRLVKDIRMGREQLLQFVQQNVDLTQKNDQGVMLGETILNLRQDPYLEKILKNMKFDWLYDDFIQSDESVVERLINSTPDIQHDNYYNYYNPGMFTYQIIKGALTQPELLNNTKYQNLFSTPSVMTHALTMSANQMVENDQFLPANLKPGVRDNLIDTALLCSMVSSSSNKKSSEKTIPVIAEKCKNRNFNPDVSLLRPDYYQALMNGILSVAKSEEVANIIALIDLGILDKELLNTQRVNVKKDSYNNVQQKQIAPYLATFIDMREDGFYGMWSRHSKANEDINYYNQTLDFVSLMEEKGLILTMTEKKKSSLDEKFKRTMKEIAHEYDYFMGFGSGSGRMKMDNELIELSYRLHMPPPILAELVDFFDKRYGFTPEKKLEQGKDKMTLVDELKDRWAGVMNRVQIVQEVVAQLDVQEDKKKKVKP